MKVLKLWMWIAILTCGLVLTSCSPDSADNPVAPASPEADKYAYSDDIDKSVVPGDDFYQYTSVQRQPLPTVLPTSPSCAPRLMLLQHSAVARPF